jgi:hypothetical protein
MRNSFSIPLLAVMLSLTIMVSCKKDNRRELLVIPDFVDFTIQPGLNTFDTHIYTISPKLSTLQTRLADLGYTLDDVVAVEGKRGYLTSVFQDENLDFIHQVSVLVFDPSHPGDKLEFFYMDPVPFRFKTTIDLFPGIADITEWMERDYFGIEVRLNFRQNSPTLIQMRLEYEVRVMGE